MEVLEPNELIAGVPRVVFRLAQRGDVLRALESLRMVRARVDAAEIALARRLKTVSPTAEQDLTNSARRSSSHGSKVVERAEITNETPALEKALAAGELAGEHVDAYAKALKNVPGPVASALRDLSELLVAQAIEAGATPNEFADQIARETKRIEGDDGQARFQRQRSATRLRTWTDKQTGLWRLSGQFDPLSGVVLHGRLQAALAAMFTNGVPSNAPNDPGERQDFLRALAFIALTAGRHQNTARAPGPESGTDSAVPRDSVTHAAPRGSDAAGDADGESAGGRLDWAPFASGGPPRFGRPEIVIIVDTTALDALGRPTIDWGLPIDIPHRALGTIGKNAKISRVVLHDGSIADAPGDLDLGRSTRLANRAQRRALRCLYATCAVPGCSVAYNYTKLHHIVWWRNGGHTNLDNLLPLCTRHHTAVHGGGWKLELGPKRHLIVTTSQGHTMKTGPPLRSSVA